MAKDHSEVNEIGAERQARVTCWVHNSHEESDDQELETHYVYMAKIQEDSITTHTYELSKEEFNYFLILYTIPSDYRVILPKSNQTVFDAPPRFIYQGSTLLVVPSSPLLLSCVKLMVVSLLLTSFEGSLICVELQRPVIMAGGKGIYLYCFFLYFPFSLIYDLLFLPAKMAFRNFIYIEDDEDLAFLPKEPSSGFGTGSLSVSVNIEPLKANEDPVIQPVEVIADSGESPKPELFVVHLGSVAAQIKDRKCKNKGGSSRPPVKRKLSIGSSTSHATRAKTSSSKEDAPFLTVSDDDECRLLFFNIPCIDATACHLKIYAITPPAWKNHLDNHMHLELLDLHDRYYARQVVVENTVNRRLPTELSTLESKVSSPKAEKARLKAVKVSLYKEVEELKKDRREVADMKDLFDLSKVKGYRSSYKKDHTEANNDFATATFPWMDKFVTDPSAPIEVLLSKKLSSLQRHVPSRTQVSLPSSQKATPSSALVSNPMSLPADSSVTKPQSSLLQ
nr:hypothetical protein [Tanacetum cinerariifolium]